MRLFVIGGAGYIGSAFVRFAQNKGHDLFIYDNLSRGHLQSVPPHVTFREADILDQKALNESLVEFQPDVILHYAAYALVGESVARPDLYYKNNCHGMQTVIDSLVQAAPNAGLIFSSSCAVFGNPTHLPVSETDQKYPTSPYGWTKLMCEQMIADYQKAFVFPAVSLRYFNAAGADLDGQHGEDHLPETHLIPAVLKSMAQGQSIKIFGSDYNTPDGTCVRDFVHVLDLAQAHLDAAVILCEKKNSSYCEAIHLGTGRGFSNLEIVRACGDLLKHSYQLEFEGRRAGDADALYADITKAKRILNLNPQHSSIEQIVASAWAWHQDHPFGYGSART